MTSPEVRREIENALGARPCSSQPLSGGSINRAFRVELDDGRAIFVKENSSADPAMFPAEARGLEWLAEPGALRIPRVLIVGSPPGQPAFLALELIESGPLRADFDEVLGRGLAALHRSGPAHFGLDHDNFIGSLPQDNEPAPSWAEFYALRRIQPQVRMAREAGLVDPEDVQALEKLCNKLPQIVPESEPSRLHGDLWGGNLHIDETGAPCLIDPAAYTGDREVDLAMMQLFGGFSRAVFHAYDEAWPLDPEWRDRVPLYQLYFLLAHVNLFGRGYLGQARSAYRRYL